MDGNHSASVAATASLNQKKKEIKQVNEREREGEEGRKREREPGSSTANLS